MIFATLARRTWGRRRAGRGPAPRGAACCVALVSRVGGRSPRTPQNAAVHEQPGGAGGGRGLGGRCGGREF